MSKVRQREELMIGNAVSSAADLDAFISGAADKELGVFGVDGGDIASGKAFKVYQKTADGYEFSDKVIPSKVDKVTVTAYSPEVQKKVTVTDFAGNEKANATYAVEVRIFNPAGALSVENFEVVTGYFVSGASVPTATEIIDGIVKSLELNLKHRGGNELTVTKTATDIVIEGKFQSNVPGKDEGRMIEFDVVGKVFDNTALTSENLNLLTVTVNQSNDYGTGTGKYATNKEWFTKGFKYDVYRETAYPANFDTPYYAEKSGKYDVVNIHYFDDRTGPSKEEQYKTLTVLGVNDATFTVANGILADLRTVGVENVPADLA